MNKLVIVFVLLFSMSANAQKYVFKVNYLAVRTQSVWSTWIEAQEASGLIIIDETNKKFTLSGDNNVELNIFSVGEIEKNKDAKGSHNFQRIGCIVPENGGVVAVDWKQYTDGENVFMLLYTGGDGLAFSCRALK